MSVWNDDAISAYIDNRLTDGTEREKIQHLLATNADTQYAATVLRTIKSKARSAGTVTTLTAPDVLRVNILSAIREEARSTSPNVVRPRSQDSLFSTILSLFRKPIIVFPAIAVVCLVGWFGYSFMNTSIAKDHDFYSDSMKNYDAILGGTIHVQCSTSNFEELSTFFKNNGIDYEIVHPYINAELVGGVISNDCGKKLAHMVYKKDGKLIYMYEVPEELFASHAMHVPEQVEPYAESGKWYASEDATNHHSWMFWRVKTTYCSVVSDLSKEQLADLFVKGV